MPIFLDTIISTLRGKQKVTVYLKLQAVTPKLTPSLPKLSGSQEQPYRKKGGVSHWKENVAGLLTESKFR